jgi:hypothetical protein
MSFGYNPVDKKREERERGERERKRTLKSFVGETHRLSADMLFDEFWLQPRSENRERGEREREVSFGYNPGDEKKREEILKSFGEGET